jgi:hypothetical protein
MRFLYLISAVTAGPAGPAALEVQAGDGYWPILACVNDNKCAAWKIQEKESF